MTHSEKIKASWRDPVIRALRCSGMKGSKRVVKNSKLNSRKEELITDIVSRKYSSGQLSEKYSCTREAILYFIRKNSLPKLDIYPSHSMEERILKSIRHSGSKSRLWRGGKGNENSKIRSGIQNRLWREAVFSRDNFTCQECGVVGGRLHAHHVKSFSRFPELRFCIDNGKTMCISCHGFFHKIDFTKLKTKTK